MNVVAFDGTIVVLSEERWRHIVFRHPELKDKLSLVLKAVSDPDEAYVDASKAIHVLKQVRGVSDFLVVIYSVEARKGGYIRTAYYTSSRRKARRYRLFKKLKLF